MNARILLGATDGQLASSLGAKLSELSDIEIHGVVRTSTDVAREVAASPDLDAVLIHQEIGPLPALELIRDLAMRHPELAFVVIAGADATGDLLSSAMEAGARGVISRDPSLAELRNRLAAATEWSLAMRRHITPGTQSPARKERGRLVALCGAKGGTGTTTLAIQLALAAAERGRTVCLADLDLQTGDIPGFLDITHRRTVADLAAAGGDVDGTMLAETLYVHPAGPHILLAPGEGERGEYITARDARQILGALRARYDVVIVDCGAYLTDGNAPAIELADSVVITATPDLPCLRAVKRLTRMWERLSLRQAADVSAVLVKHSRRNEIQPEFARKMLDLPMLRTTVPPAYRALEDAVHSGSMTVGNDDYRRAITALAAETGVAGAAAAGNGKSRRRRNDHGSVTVEFGVMIPLFGLILFLIWQLLLVGLTSMYASHAANEGARAAAVLGTGPEGMREVRRRSAERVGAPWNDSEHFRLRAAGDTVRVTIDAPVVMPGWSSPFGVSAESTIVREGEVALP